MGILDKSRKLASKAVDSTADIVDQVTGRALVQETEQFHREMETVYAALVTRTVAAEGRIDRLERQLKWAIALSVIATAISLVFSLLRFS